MELGLQGKLAVVTGASKGIGLAVTRALVDEGARVIAGSRSSSDELEALSRTGDVRVVEVDLADGEEYGDRQVHATKRGGRSRLAPDEPPHGERDRHEHHHRRRPDHHALTLSLASTNPGRTRWAVSEGVMIAARALAVLTAVVRVVMS